MKIMRHEVILEISIKLLPDGCASSSVTEHLAEPVLTYRCLNINVTRSLLVKPSTELTPNGKPDRSS